MCNYQGFVKNSSIDQLYHYHAALGPTCHSKSGRKEEQEREREERERERRDADRKEVGSSMVTSGSLLNYR